METGRVAQVSNYKKQELGYQIEDIQIISFAANGNALPDIDNDDLEQQLKWELSFSESLYADEEEYNVSLLLNLFYVDKSDNTKKRAGALEVNFDFKLHIMQQLFERGEVPVDIKNNLLSISVSTARGIWLAKVAGTAIANVLIPLFAPTELRNNIKDDLEYRVSCLEEYIELKNYPKAIAIGKELHEEYPEELSVIDRVGYSLVQAAQYKEALEYTEKRSKLSPDTAKSLSNKGFILTKIGRVDEALSTLKAALQLDPNDLQVINRYIALSLQAQKFDDIEAFIKENENKHESDYVFLNVLAEYKRAIHNIEGAIETIYKAIVLEPDNWEAYITLALAYYDEGNVGDAVDQIKIALKLGAAPATIKHISPLKKIIEETEELKSLFS